MVEAATTVMGGIKIDGTVLRLYPSANGMQHDERKSGFPILTSWLRLTWPGKQRNIDDPYAPLHDSVYQRFALPGVVHYDNMQRTGPKGCDSMRNLLITTRTFRRSPRGRVSWVTSRAFF